MVAGSDFRGRSVWFGDFDLLEGIQSGVDWGSGIWKWNLAVATQEKGFTAFNGHSKQSKFSTRNLPSPKP